MTHEERCDLSDLFKSQCHHCVAGYPTLGPDHRDHYDTEGE